VTIGDGTDGQKHLLSEISAIGLIFVGSAAIIFHPPAIFNMILPTDHSNITKISNNLLIEIYRRIIYTCMGSDSKSGMVGTY